MKETKVYVDELPENCKKCVYSQINLALGVETRICGLQYGFISIDIDKFPNCPLQSLQIHDRELVRQVCEKISIELENETKTYCEIRRCSSPHYQGDYVWFNYVKFRIFIAQILKEVE